MISFFDLDGTLIRPRSLISFYEFYASAGRPEAIGDGGADLFNVIVEEKMRVTPCRVELNRWFYHSFISNEPRPKLAHWSRRWFAACLASGDFFHPAMVEELNKRVGEGYLPVIVTGSFYEVVKPIADFLGIDDIVCAPLEEIEGRYTGRLKHAPTIAAGKVEAIGRFMSQRTMSLKQSFGYGDDITDLDLLEVVENPVAFNSSALRAIAAERKWNFISGQ